MHMFLSLITKLCIRSRVEEYLGDNWTILKTTTYPLKMHDEGIASKSKKMKIDLGKLVDNDINSCRPTLEGPI